MQFKVGDIITGIERVKWPRLVGTYTVSAIEGEGRETILKLKGKSQTSGWYAFRFKLVKRGKGRIARRTARWAPPRKGVANGR